MMSLKIPTATNLPLSNQKIDENEGQASFDNQEATTNDTNNLAQNNINSNQNEGQSKTSKRTRTMCVTNQEKNYGPKATLRKVHDDCMQLVQDPLSQHLFWTKPPVYVLVIKKLCNNLFDAFIEIIKHLIFNHHLIVYVEESQYDHEIFKADDQIKMAMKPYSNSEKPALRKFIKSSNLSPAKNEDRNKIDLIICLGGDGTLLHASTLFQQSCPPVLSIHMGSLGFLCPFDFENYRGYVNGALKGGVPLLLRNRLRCRIEKSLEASDKSDDSIANSSNIHVFNSSRFIDSSYLNEDDVDDKKIEWLSLNEVVISRGPSPFLSNLDLYINDYLITTVQGDGLIISTPTGSTAYAMAAGASMSHPSIPAIIIAPICPHSLSFRPITVPAGVELKISLSPDTRNTAWYSIDGRNTSELKHGYHLSIKTSEYPLPSVCRNDPISDWFEGLATCLHWNQRQKQLPINSCYLQSRSLTPSVSQSQLHSPFSSSSSTSSLLKNQSSAIKPNDKASANNMFSIASTISNKKNNERSNSNESSHNENDLENQIETLNSDFQSSSFDYTTGQSESKSLESKNEHLVKFGIDYNL